jgi:Phosphoglycerate dehydrogenase and related dehydrogenases
MYKYHCLNPIAKVGLNKFTSEYVEVEEVTEAEAVLVRSASMHELELGAHVKAIARAGAGVNNIPLDKYANQGVVVFNTPGANANGVKELVIAGMLLASRDIVGGIEWVKEFQQEEEIAKLAEAQKKMFAGSELDGKKLGVIGLGAIGVLVANAATHMGMEVYGYDPYVSVDSAWQLSRSIHHAMSVEEIYKSCDFISIHVPFTDKTKGMIDANAISLMKENAVILNFARDQLVCEGEIVTALKEGKIKNYVTDFPNQTIAGMPGAIVIPHLGASTEESEDNCAKMAVKEIREYLENGNIRNSVNWPNCDMGNVGENIRITILHKNIPNMIGQFTNIMAQYNMNIADMTNKSKNEFAYTMIDVDTEFPQEVVQKFEQIQGVLRVRILREEIK